MRSRLVTVRLPGARMARSAEPRRGANSAGKERRKAQDHCGEAGWQVQHGGVSGWGRIQPNQSPASPPMPTSDGQSRAQNLIY
jgi:hypothetical protein